MARQVYSLPEPNVTIKKLHRAGLVLVRDVLQLSADQLSSSAHLSASEATFVLQRAGRRPALTSGRPRPAPGHVVSFSRRLDALLGGGVALGWVTELVAPPGGGKTQLCLQACVDATLPAELGGLSAVSLYIDTEDSPVTARLRSMATAAVSHCQRAALSTGDGDARTAAEQLTAETILSRVQIIRAGSAVDLLLLPSVLPEILERDNVRLVCIDSVAAPWRGAEAGPRRAQELQWLAAQLRRLARRHAAAVLITNHVTTLIEPDSSSLVPALGASWQHCAAVRLWIDIRGDTRVARLLKHPERPDGEAAFQILEVGVRDVCGEVEEEGESDEDSEEEDAPDGTGGVGERGTGRVSSESAAAGAGAGAEPGDTSSEAVDRDGVADHVIKQRSGASNHVTSAESGATEHVNKERDAIGHVTKEGADATDETPNKRRRVQ